MVGILTDSYFRVLVRFQICLVYACDAVGVLLIARENDSCLSYKDKSWGLVEHRAESPKHI